MTESIFLPSSIFELLDIYKVCETRIMDDMNYY